MRSAKQCQECYCIGGVRAYRCILKIGHEGYHQDKYDNTWQGAKLKQPQKKKRKLIERKLIERDRLATRIPCDWPGCDLARFHEGPHSNNYHYHDTEKQDRNQKLKHSISDGTITLEGSSEEGCVASIVFKPQDGSCNAGKTLFHLDENDLNMLIKGMARVAKNLKAKACKAKVK